MTTTAPSIEVTEDFDDSTPIIDCPICSGTGEIVDCNGLGHTCPACGGDGDGRWQHDRPTEESPTIHSPL